MNPCRCGWYGNPSGRCRCSEQSVQKYRSKISGPLLDRIDLLVEVPALEYDELARRGSGETSEQIRTRVNAARTVQTRRFGNSGTTCNARMTPRELDEYCALDETCSTLMRQAFDALGLTARSHGRILRVARTIADLDGAARIGPRHLAEAVQYRTFDFGDNKP